MPKTGTVEIVSMNGIGLDLVTAYHAGISIAPGQ
jgi:hypothetical protein